MNDQEKWICKECLFREQKGKDPILNYFCSYHGTDYPFVVKCPHRLTLSQITDFNSTLVRFQRG